MTREPINTAQSELRSIARAMGPPSDAEARAQRRQTRMPWVWFMIGLLLVAGFAGVLLLVGPSPLSTAPMKSLTFSDPVKHS